jgi:DNA-binding NtrC family response regulator
MQFNACGNNSVGDQTPVGLIGNSAWARRLRSQIQATAACPSNVLITGPTGTGKEVIARAVHECSCRARLPFIPVDCAAAAGPLFASHLFGHLKGAFTGAGYAALGCFRAADGGTVFLDEIGELPCDMQIKLLRVLQQRTVTPLGSHAEVPVNIRIIAATNRNLEREVREGRFREDLFYRLNVVSLKTLSLCERPEDVEALAEHFLSKLAITHGLPARRLSAAALRRLEGCDWPGNVRQLENVLERAAFTGRGEVIDAAELSIGNVEQVPPAGPETVSLPIISPAGTACAERPSGDCCLAVVDGHWRTMEEVEREHLRRTLALTGWNQSAAARVLGMERHQLARKIRKYDLESAASKPGGVSKRAA